MSISEIPPKAHTHHGNCHCGAYRVTINLSQPIRSVTACSCIICRAQGYLFLPSDSRLNLELKIVKDEGVLTEYRQGDVIHKVCHKCRLLIACQKTDEGHDSFVVDADLDAW